MADTLGKIAEELSRGIHGEENLSPFAVHMMTLCRRYGGIQTAFLYPLIYHESEKEKLTENQQKWTAELVERIAGEVSEDFSGEKLEEEIKKIHRLRGEVIREVQSLSELADGLSIWEWVLNRMEYRFRDHGHIEEKEDGTFVQELLAFALEGKDPALKNIRIQEIVRQLPVRMTKAKFYALLEEALSLYEGTDKKGFLQFLYRIKGGYKNLSSGIFSDTDFSNITKEQFEQLSRDLDKEIKKTRAQMEYDTLLLEVINPCYAMMLTKPYAMEKGGEKEHVEEILKIVAEGFSAPKKVSLESRLEEHYQALEGKVEELAEQFEKYGGRLPEIQEQYGQLIPGVMADKMYASLERICLLLSSSRFVSLEKEKEEQAAVESAQIEAAKKELEGQLDQVFQSVPKCVKRAVMANILGLLPVFFQDTEEIREYFEESLSSCRDRAEKAACIEILQNMMEEAYAVV